MQCKICNLNETDSTSGICWECINNMNIEQTNKRIRKKLMQLVDYHHVGHEVDFKTGFQCAFIKGQECNCGWREYEDDVMKLIESTLKEERKRIIEEMLVEEGIKWMQEGNRKDRKGYTEGFNQCCALQKEKAKKLLNNMKTIEQTKKEFEKIKYKLDSTEMEWNWIEKALKESYNKGYEEGLNTKVVGSTKVKSKTTHDRGGGLADLI